MGDSVESLQGIMIVGDGRKSISSSCGSTMAAPYPNFPPEYGTVRKNGGYTRDCLVIDLLSLGPIDKARMAQLEDAVAMAISKFQEIEKHTVVRSDNFNVHLSQALRL